MAEAPIALAELRVADPRSRWEALGFAVVDGVVVLDGVAIRLDGPGHGITAWSVSGIGPVHAVDGLLTIAAGQHAPAAEHPNGAQALDHVVVVTPAFERTSAALDSAGISLRRIRTVGDGEGAFRQGFRRLGPAILEVVETRQMEAGPARFWGLVVIVGDLDALAARLGERLSAPKPAVQPGRRIATLRASAGCSPRVAFMDPEPDQA